MPVQYRFQTVIPEELRRVLSGLPRGRYQEAMEGSLRPGLMLFRRAAENNLRKRPYSEGVAPSRTENFRKRKKLRQGIRTKTHRYRQGLHAVYGAVGFPIKLIKMNFSHALLAEFGTKKPRVITAGVFRGSRTSKVVLAGPKRGRARRPRTKRTSILLGKKVTHFGSRPVHYLTDAFTSNQNNFGSTVIRELKKRTDRALQRYAQDLWRGKLRKIARKQGFKASTTNLNTRSI